MMFKYWALALFIAYLAEAQADCLPEPNCENCSVDCKGNVRAVYVGDDCCESCVSTLGLGYSCNPSIEPNPNCPPGPSGDPRVPTSNPICAKGLRCDQRSRKCENPGEMSDTSSLRDAIFYRWHRYVDDIFKQYKLTL